MLAEARLRRGRRSFQRKTFPVHGCWEKRADKRQEFIISRSMSRVWQRVCQDILWRAVSYPRRKMASLSRRSFPGCSMRSCRCTLGRGGGGAMWSANLYGPSGVCARHGQATLDQPCPNA